MPVERGATNGSGTGRFSGAYAYVLQKICERDAHNSMPCILDLGDSEWDNWDRMLAEKVAALIAERNGKPLRVMSHMLPPNLPPPYERGGRRRFIIEPTDEIRLVSTELRTA